VAGYKPNIPKLVVFLYTSKKHAKKEIRKTISFTIASVKLTKFQNKYHLGINLPGEVQDVYNENYKTLRKDIKEGTKRFKALLYSWINRINIFK
jgi:hypothetical protein